MTMNTIETWKHAAIKNELREVRKLLNIIQTQGNVLVNGNITAGERMSQLIGILKDNGIDTPTEAENAIYELETYYPSK